jgi:hypothetical protein
MGRRHLGCSLLLALAGCGGSTTQFPVPLTDDGGLPGRILPDVAVLVDAAAKIDANTSGDGGRIGDATTGEPSLLKVTLEIKSPTADQVVPAHERFVPVVDITIDSSQATSPDNISDVTAVVTKMGAKMSAVSGKLAETKIEQTPESATSIHHFTDTPVDLSALESGTYDLKVTGKTLGGVMVESTVRFTVDAGPVVRIDSPGENKYYRSSCTVDVTVTDPLFAPVKVSMYLGQRLLDNVAANPNGSQYTATIEFGAYDPPLEGDLLLTVNAVNSKGTTTVVRRKFIADNKGPTITSTVPQTGALIGRVITVSAVITDPAGVLDSSVVAVVAHGDSMYEVKLQPATGAGVPPNTYQALFDTSRLPITAIFPSVSFRASDLPGNQSSVGYLLSLDNTPPLADLDPPENLRLVRKQNDVFECSHPFDPLGESPDAVNDLESRNQLFDIRARIEDQGNTPVGQVDYVPIAGIDDSRVQLLILNDTTQPLVVDSNNDGLCDAINPLLTPTTTPMSDKDALLINMVPLSPAGVADFSFDNTGNTAVCKPGTEPKSPDRLCATTNLSVVISGNVTGVPGIYTIPPVVADKLQCVGRQFDTLGNHVKDGWVCLAVAVADKLGNLQVSRPIRVCVDKDGVGNECGVGRAAAPDCTGTVTATKPAVVVDGTKHCSPWRSYIQNEYRAIF